MLHEELYNAIRELPVIDVHTHLRRDNLCAPDVGAILFYHMVQYPLRAAGVDAKALWPGRGFHGAGRPYEQAMDHWPMISDTSFGWGLKTILRELYGFDEPITPSSLPRLQHAFDAKIAQGDWGEQVRATCRIRRLLSSQIRVPPLAEGQADHGVRFTVESTPTSGNSEMRPWSQRIAGLNKLAGREITRLSDLRETIVGFYDQFDWSDKHALVAWITSAADFSPVDDSAIDGLLADCQAGRPIDLRGRLALEAAVIRCICQAIRGRTGVFQICYGTQFLTEGDGPHPVARAHPQFASSFACLLGEFPDLHFNILSGYEIDEPIWCSLCLGYPNISLAGYWWGMFYPSVMESAWRRRLDMVPASRLCGFFSDGWTIDWTFGRLRTTQRVLATVLAEKIDRGYYTADQALGVARRILFETPRTLFLPGEEVED